MKWNPSSFILGISFSIFLSSLGYAQGGQVGTNLNAFKVWLDVASSSVLPILPIQGALHIKNSSASPVTVRLSPGTQISFKLGNGEWRPYHPDGVPIATPAPPREFRFLAGQQVDFPIYVDSTLNGPGADLTANPGVMQIRASWGPFQTAPATITVLRPSGEDLA